MKIPTTFLTADCASSKPTAKCFAFFVEQMPANHTTRFAEQSGLNGYILVCEDQRRGIFRCSTGLLTTPNERGQSEEPRYA
jgi:hypothetical protein